MKRSRSNTLDICENIPNLRSYLNLNVEYLKNSIGKPILTIEKGDVLTNLTEKLNDVHVYQNLKQKLKETQSELKSKNEKCEILIHTQEQTQKELQDLTASLFEEANKMVQDANARRVNSEKKYLEARYKIDILEAEVNALKALVLHSTPQNWNKNMHYAHLHNNKTNNPKYLNQNCDCHRFNNNSSNCDNSNVDGQCGTAANDKKIGGIRFLPGHKRSTSVIEMKNKSSANNNLKNFHLNHGTSLNSRNTLHHDCKSNSLPNKNMYQNMLNASSPMNHHDFTSKENDFYNNREIGAITWENYEVDPVYFDEFVTWHRNYNIVAKSNGSESNGSSTVQDGQHENPFIKRLYEQDILPALEFKNIQLSSQVLKALKENCLTIETNLYNEDANIPKQCSLTNTTKICPYKMKLEEIGPFYYVGESTRNRVRLF
ncbi:unnamed protein product [Gordionus sp. m RMFG-2023]